MRLWGIVVVAAIVLSAPAVSFAQAPPPPSGGAMPWDPEPPTPLYLGRVELDFEFVQPAGELDELDVVDETRAIRAAIGFNITELISMNFGSRFLLIGEDNFDQDFYYFDMLMLGLRVNYDTGHKVTIYAGGDLSMTGMSVPCNQPDPPSGCDFSSDPTAFTLRFGVHWRAGVNYLVQPGRFELGAHLTGSQTIPDYIDDAAGWLSFGVGMVVHMGVRHPSQQTGHGEPVQLQKKRRGYY